MSVLELEYAPDTAPLAWESARFGGRPLQQAARRAATLIDWPQPEPRWKTIVEDRLQKLGSYGAGWDGYQGKPPRRSVIAFARNILNSVMKVDTPAPSIVPFSGGGLQLEWHTNGFDVELAIYAPFQAELSVERADGGEEIDEACLETDFRILGSVVAELA